MAGGVVSVYVNGELLRRWRREAAAHMRAKYLRLQHAAESCQSHKEGDPGDYAKSLAIIAGCYLRAAECFRDPAEESNARVDRAGASDAGQTQKPIVAGSESNDLLDGGRAGGDP